MFPLGAGDKSKKTPPRKVGSQRRGAPRRPQGAMHPAQAVPPQAPPWPESVSSFEVTQHSFVSQEEDLKKRKDNAWNELVLNSINVTCNSCDLNIAKAIYQKYELPQTEAQSAVDDLKNRRSILCGKLFSSLLTMQDPTGEEALKKDYLTSYRDQNLSEDMVEVDWSYQKQEVETQKNRKVQEDRKRQEAYNTTFLNLFKHRLFINEWKPKFLAVFSKDCDFQNVNVSQKDVQKVNDLYTKWNVDPAKDKDLIKQMKEALQAHADTVTDQLREAGYLPFSSPETEAQGLPDVVQQLLQRTLEVDTMMKDKYGSLVDNFDELYSEVKNWLRAKISTTLAHPNSSNQRVLGWGLYLPEIRRAEIEVDKLESKMEHKLEYWQDWNALIDALEKEERANLGQTERPNVPVVQQQPVAPMKIQHTGVQQAPPQPLAVEQEPAALSLEQKYVNLLGPNIYQEIQRRQQDLKDKSSEEYYNDFKERIKLFRHISSFNKRHGKDRSGNLIWIDPFINSMIDNLTTTSTLDYDKDSDVLKDRVRSDLENLMDKISVETLPEGFLAALLPYCNRLPRIPDNFPK